MLVMDLQHVKPAPPKMYDTIIKTSSVVTFTVHSHLAWHIVGYTNKKGHQCH